MIIKVDNFLYKALRLKNGPPPKPSEFGLKAEQIYFTSNDGLKLTAFVIKTDSASQKGTVLLIHGMRSTKEKFLPISKILAKNGFNSIAVDLRAHGESEGKYSTFGFKERQDILILLDSLNAVEDLNKNFGIWGHSMGGATALQLMAMDKRIQYGIIESSYAEFKTTVYDYARGMSGFSIPFLNDYLIWRAERMADFDPEKIDPKEYAKHITQPVLMVHGENDNRIKIEYAKKNFNNLKSSDKNFISIPEAGHSNIWEVAGEEYFSQVLEFLNKVSD